MIYSIIEKVFVMSTDPNRPSNCPNCGNPLQEREGKFGKFLGFTGYPDCKFLLNLK